MIELPDKARHLQYWDTIFSRGEIAAITGRVIDSVTQWKYYDIPKTAQLLLMIYSGELTLDEWEDYVDEKAVQLCAQTYNVRRRQVQQDEKRRQKAKEANDKLEARCGV